MEKLDEAQWPLDQTGHLDAEENIPIMNNHRDKVEEDDKKEQGDREEEEEEPPLPKMIPTYAPQEPREEEADDEEEGESSISTDLHSWGSMPMSPSFNPLEAYESKSNDAEDVFANWTKEIPTEEEAVTREAESPKIPARKHFGSFECRRKQIAAFCERYWKPFLSQTSSSTVRQKFSNLNNFRAIPNRQYFVNQQICNKRSFSHQFSDNFSGEGYRQRNIKRGFNQNYSDRAAATFHRRIHLEKGPASRFHHRKEPHDSNDSLSNSSSRQNVYRPSRLSHGTIMTVIQHRSESTAKLARYNYVK